MVKVEFNKGLTKEDIGVGKIFDGELILNRDDNNPLVNMTTARRIDEFEIQVIHYDIIFKGNKIGSMNYNGIADIYHEDNRWQTLDNKLRQVGL